MILNDREPGPYAVVECDPRFLTLLFSPTQYPIRCVSGLPADAAFVALRREHTVGGCFYPLGRVFLIFKHDSFPVVGLGCAITEITPVFTDATM